MLQSLNNLYRKENVRNISLKLGKVQNWQSYQDIINEIVKFKMLQSLNNLYHKENVRKISLKLGKVQNWQSY